MVLIEQGAWAVPYALSGPPALIVQIVIMYHIVRETEYVDRRHYALLHPGNSASVGGLVPSQCSHSQSASQDWSCY